jgi:D-methionine transport system substrate-binding protein
MRKWIIGLIALLAIAAIGWFSFGNKSTASSDTITLGIMAGTSDGDKQWDLVKKNLESESKYKLKIVKFTDYSQPNKAVEDGDTFANSFQHYAFLSEWNKKNKGDIVAAGDTVITPIRLYSDKHKSIDEIPNGATIAIPNDASNEGRSLKVLQSAGLITLNDATNPTVKDIATNPKNLTIKEVAADTTARSLQDVDAAIINTNYAEAAKIDLDSALYIEPINADSHQWINFIATKKADKNDPKTKALVKAFQQDNVANFIIKTFKGAETPAWTGAPVPSGQEAVPATN